MSFQVTTAFVQQYKSTVLMLAQQTESRLRDTVTVEPSVVGKSVYLDQFGIATAQIVTNRHGDSPLLSTPQDRRRIDLTDYEYGDLIDKADKVRLLIDPTSATTRAAAMAMGRAIDDEIIAHAYATAFTGETGANSVAFPASQQISVSSWAYGTGSGNVGLTVSKLIEAKMLLDQNESDPREQRTIVCQAKQIGNLLATTEVTSEDYNTVKALSTGTIDTFMGFKFVRSERLPVDGSGYRRVLCYSKSGLGLGLGMDITTEIAPRPDKRFSTYVYFMMSIGASRLEEKKVIEIKCL